MERLESLARYMLENQGRFQEAAGRKKLYGEKRAREMGITEEEFWRLEYAQKVYTMREECIFGEKEDIIIFADSWKSVSPAHRDLERARQICREGRAHRHEFFEMFYVLKGFCYNYVDGQEEVFPEGSMCIYNCQSAHERILPDEEAIILNLCIRRKAMETHLVDLLREMPLFWRFFVDSLGGEERPAARIRLDGEQNHELESLFYHILRAYLLGDATSQTVMRCQFVCLMAEMMRMRLSTDYDPDALGAPKARGEVDQILEIIQAECNALSLADLAQRTHFSPGHLSRLLKAQTGRTFHEIQSAYWLEKAKALLYCTSFSIDSVAELMGASARANFERKFKSLSGQSPAQFRQGSLRPCGEG